MLEGNFSIIIIDKRTDDVIDNTCGFRKTSTRETPPVFQICLAILCPVFQSQTHRFSAIKHDPKRAKDSSKSFGSSSRPLSRRRIRKDCEDVVGSKIYISREKSGTTVLFMIIVAKDDSDSF
jgi:hypothetical protein